MGGDCGSWIPQQHFDWQSPSLRSFGALPNEGQQNGILPVMNSGISKATRNEAMPVNTSLELPHLRLGISDECNSWLCGLPRFQRAVLPSLNLTVGEKHPAGHLKNYGDAIQPNGQLGLPQKQFLVIDQSGDQTTFLYSSGFGNPTECLASWHSKRHGPYNLDGDEPSFRRRELNDLMGPTLADKIDENCGTDVQSEMHEDTEEINALLYSDSDGYSTEDDEVTSTGHSPSTMTTGHDNQGLRGGTEEIANFTEKSRKRKLSDRAYDDDDDDIQLTDTASSLNLSRPFDDKDDAESRCSSGGRNKSGGSYKTGGSLSANKKMRKERIRDVLSILQSIIPGGKDKDPITLLDEAIRCLKSLKLKANALGLDVL